MFIPKTLFNITPIGYIYAAFSELRQKFEPIDERIREVFEYYGNQRFNRALYNPVTHFFNEQGIRDDLALEYSFINSCYCSIGTNVKSGYAAIKIPEGLLRRDENIANYLIKKQVYHIKHNLNFKEPFFAALISIAAFTIFASLSSLGSALVISCIVAKLASSIISSLNNEKSENFALSHSSEAELSAAKRFYLAQIEFKLDLKDQNIAYDFLINSQGEDRFGFFSPTSRAIISKIQQIQREQGFQTYGENLDTTEIMAFFDEFVEKNKEYNVLVYS